MNNILIYHDIYLDVEPKRQKLNEAVEQLNQANKKLAAVRAHVQSLEDRKAELGKLLEDSTNEKNELVLTLTLTLTHNPSPNPNPNPRPNPNPNLTRVDRLTLNPKP